MTDEQCYVSHNLLGVKFVWLCHLILIKR